MRKPTVVVLAALALAFTLSAVAVAHDNHPAAATTAAAATTGSWKGEIVDIACYVPKGAKGAGHADCAKKCVKGGQPMGLLTGDDDMVLLVADHANGKPFEAAQDLAGSKAEVTGKMETRGGVKIVTVTGVKAAS